MLIALGLVALSMGFGSGWKLRDLSADAELAEVKAYHAQRESAWERASRESTDLQRQIETARRKVADKEIQDAQHDAALDARRAADLRVVADQLRAHVARLTSTASEGGGDPPAAGGSPPATGPDLVLADLYRSVDDEAQELAAAFDRSRRAGLTCERIYTSLNAH